MRNQIELGGVENMRTVGFTRRQIRSLSKLKRERAAGKRSEDFFNVQAFIDLYDESQRDKLNRAAHDELKTRLNILHGETFTTLEKDRIVYMRTRADRNGELGTGQIHEPLATVAEEINSMTNTLPTNGTRGLFGGNAGKTGIVFTTQEETIIMYLKKARRDNDVVARE